MRDMDFRDRWVLVTGASSGLGEEMARQLARVHGAHLVLVARRGDKLAELAAELRTLKTQVRWLAADLSTDEGVETVRSYCKKEIKLYAAILNAGITHFGHHDDLQWEHFERMLDLNIKGTARLVHHLLPMLEKRAQGGGLLLIASLTGITPVAYQSAYSGSKAFLVHYGCSLHHEMKARGVSVTTFAPGGMATEMTHGELFDDLRCWLAAVEPCARAGLKGFAKRRYLVVPGVMYRFSLLLARLLPENFVVGRVAAQYRRALARQH